MTSNAAAEIYALQCDQLRHDELYHKDVVIMSLGDRMKHMALHDAKYVGYLLDALEQNDDTRFERVLTDAFVIALAAANTMNQDLGADIGELAERCDDIGALGRSIVQMSDGGSASPWGMIAAFARATGLMAKTCESLDHLDDIPFRRHLCESNLKAFRSVIAAAAEREIPIVARYRDRIAVLEARSIFRGVQAVSSPDGL